MNRRLPACKAGALPLSYIPNVFFKMVGRGRFELPTSRLSAVCSNQLSYRPTLTVRKETLTRKNFLLLLRKEVIQPHLPVRLPCYDFTPLTLHTFDASIPIRVWPAASGADNSGGVTGGVYKARERIHRSLADLRLLAIPTSCSRVADCNPNWDRL